MVPVPSAEEIVGGLRRKLDPSHAAVPAHITILYPFAPESSISPALVDKVSEVLARFEPFDFVLSEIGWFGDQVVYLAPSPGVPFVDLTTSILAAFPEYPPYGGAYDEVVPHLAICEGVAPARMRRAARRLEQRLPISASARQVLLMTPGPGDLWEIRRRFSLGVA